MIVMMVISEHDRVRKIMYISMFNEQLFRHATSP